MHVAFKIHYRNNLIDKKILTKFHVRHLGMTVITVTVINITPVKSTPKNLINRQLDQYCGKDTLSSFSVSHFSYCLPSLILKNKKNLRKNSNRYKENKLSIKIVEKNTPTK